MTALGQGVIAGVLRPLLAFALLLVSAQSALATAGPDYQTFGVRGPAEIAAPAISAMDCILSPVRTEAACRLAPLPTGTGPSPVRIVPLVIPERAASGSSQDACACLAPPDHLRPPLRAPPSSV